MAGGKLFKQPDENTLDRILKIKQKQETPAKTHAPMYAYRGFARAMIEAIENKKKSFEYEDDTYTVRQTKGSYYVYCGPKGGFPLGNISLYALKQYAK